MEGRILGLQARRQDGSLLELERARIVMTIKDHIHLQSTQPSKKMSQAGGGGGREKGGARGLRRGGR
jgi:hypothetical protein